MPRATSKKEQPWHYDPVVWGIGGVYLIGILMAGTIQVMTSAPSLRNTVQLNYNQSKAGFESVNSEGLFGTVGNTAAVPANNASLLVNGSFEMPIIRAESGLVTEDNPFLGWKVSWSNAGDSRQMRFIRQPGLELLAGYQGWQAAEGAQFARLDAANLGARSASTQSLVTISQDVTVAAGSYELNFDFAAQPKTSKADNQLEILWNNTTIATLSLDGGSDVKPNWHHYTYTLEATGKGETLTVVGKGSENNKGVLVDNFTLNPAK